VIELAYLQNEIYFPPLENATPEGLLAYGGDLSAKRLLYAYSRGIFPWYNEGDPILWWAPDPRLVLFVDEFKLRKSLKKRFKHFEVRYDTAFKEVMQACRTVPREGQEGTWILPELIDAFCGLHEMGYAHSVEAWQEGELVGGLYGLVIGKMFFGESMFAKVSDASKVAFAHLVSRLKEEGFTLIDCQVSSEHLISLGAREISRQEFTEHINVQISKGNAPSQW